MGFIASFSWGKKAGKLRQWYHSRSPRQENWSPPVAAAFFVRLGRRLAIPWQEWLPQRESSCYKAGDGATALSFVPRDEQRLLENGMKRRPTHMRSFVITLAVLLAAGLTAQAQPPQPPTAPTEKKLDEYLQRWELEMQKIQSLEATLERTQKDKAFQTESKFVGFARYMKDGTGPTARNLAMLEMKEAGKQDIYEKYICTGTFLYQFSPTTKEIRALRLPTPKPGQVGDDNFLTFLFGMKAEQAKKRYDLKVTREDQYYIYLDVVPRTPQDTADFKRAQLVLNKETFLPRQLWFEQPNGNTIVWSIPRLDTKAKINEREFDAPALPPGWKMVTVERPPETPAPVVRPAKP
jgi:TIGR03009 family protein